MAGGRFIVRARYLLPKKRCVCDCGGDTFRVVGESKIDHLKRRVETPRWNSADSGRLLTGPSTSYEKRGHNRPLVHDDHKAGDTLLPDPQKKVIVLAKRVALHSQLAQRKKLKFLKSSTGSMPLRVQGFRLHNREQQLNIVKL